MGEEKNYPQINADLGLGEDLTTEGTEGTEWCRGDAGGSTNGQDEGKILDKDYMDKYR